MPAKSPLSEDCVANSILRRKTKLVVVFTITACAKYSCCAAIKLVSKKRQNCNDIQSRMRELIWSEKTMR